VHSTYRQDLFYGLEIINPILPPLPLFSPSCCEARLFSRILLVNPSSFLFPSLLLSHPTHTMSKPNRTRGAVPPKMIEFERQAEQRAREQDEMAAAQDRMLEAQSRIAQEAERIAQEQYEMEQYYETEALKHAEEMRVHLEEVKRHEGELLPFLSFRIWRGGRKGNIYSKKRMRKGHMYRRKAYRKRGEQTKED
jgi:hypothetical protein